MPNASLNIINDFYSLIYQNFLERIKVLQKVNIEYLLFNNFLDDFLKSLFQFIEFSDEKLLDENISKWFITFSENGIDLIELNFFLIQIKRSIKEVLLNRTNDLIVSEYFFESIYDQIDKAFTKYSVYSNQTQLKILISDCEKLKKELELNQQYLQNILNVSDSAIMVISNNEEFVAWSKGAEKIFGYTREEIIGQKSNFLLPPGEKYLEELLKITSEVNTSGYTKILETERKTKDNKIIPVQLSVAKLSENKSAYSGRTVVITDVTETRKLQQQVDQSEKLAVIGQLAAGVAHEIGNPLASISSIVQILQRKSTDAFISSQLDHVKENINRISNIVRELVDLSRPPSHNEIITQIGEVIKTAVGIVKYDKRVKKVEFKADIDPNMPMVKTVPDQLLQVFINILINALDAVEGEGIIKVKSHFDDNFIYVEIEDNGCGIEEKIIDKIFNPFFTTKEVGKGTGLGLSVSYGIVKKLNGDILINSKLNEGSKFIVKIPYK